MKIKRALRIKKTAPWLARLALFALLFQISAVDHHSHPEEVTGVVGSSAHKMHCHGVSAGCANGSGEMPGILTQASLLPTPPSLVLLSTAEELIAPADADLEVGTRPPRL